MHNHIRVVDLACRLPDGGTVFASLTFAFDMVRTGLVGPNFTITRKTRMNVSPWTPG